MQKRLLTKEEQIVVEKVHLFFIDLFDNELNNKNWDLVHSLSGNIIVYLLNNICFQLFQNNITKSNHFIDQIVYCSKHEIKKAFQDGKLN
jgi:hypothetical protein